jgi:signal transduction histidine kinase
MNRIVKEVVQTFEYEAAAKQARVTLGDLPRCYGDETMVIQIFVNLIGNALKYLDPERQGVIEISGTKKDSHAVYCVRDNGIGIALQHREKIFEIFYQLNPSIQGEGLGLSIVQKAVDMHRGSLWIESEPGSGTSVHVALPAHEKMHSPRGVS